MGCIALVSKETFLVELHDRLTVFYVEILLYVFKKLRCHCMISNREIFSILYYYQTMTQNELIEQTRANYEGWNFNSGNYLFTIDTK